MSKAVLSLHQTQISQAHKTWLTHYFVHNTLQNRTANTLKDCGAYLHPLLTHHLKILKIICWYRHVCHSGHVEVKEQLSRVNSLLPQGSEESLDFQGDHLYPMSHLTNPNHIYYYYTHVLTMWAHACIHKGQRTVCRSWSSPSARWVWVLHIILRLPGLVISTLLTKPCHWLRSDFLMGTVKFHNF